MEKARERDLRDQLQNILRELEELQQQPTPGSAAKPFTDNRRQLRNRPVGRPSRFRNNELSDVGIVSDRVQRRPEGLSMSTEQSRRNPSPPGP